MNQALQNVLTVIENGAILGIPKSHLVHILTEEYGIHDGLVDVYIKDCLGKGWISAMGSGRYVITELGSHLLSRNREQIAALEGYTLTAYGAANPIPVEEKRNRNWGKAVVQFVVVLAAALGVVWYVIDLVRQFRK